MLIKTDATSVEFFGGSDFHLEFAVGRRFFDPEDFLPSFSGSPSAFKICLLAGDITRPVKTHRYTKWFESFCSKFDLVFYVSGNHEHWGGALNANFVRLRRDCAHIQNLHFMDRELVEFSVNDHKFAVVGATLWGDLDQNTFVDNSELAAMPYPLIVDFRKIRLLERGSYKRFSVKNYRNQHILDRQFIAEASRDLSHKHDTFKVLLTHHAPTLKSLDNELCRESAFDASDLEAEIHAGGFNLCFHGHIHRDREFSCKIGSTIVASKPCGYEVLGSADARYSLMNLSLVEI